MSAELQLVDHEDAAGLGLVRPLATKNMERDVSWKG